MEVCKLNILSKRKVGGWTHLMKNFHLNAQRQTRIFPMIVDDVKKDLDNDKITPKTHSGRIKTGTVSLPEVITSAIKEVCKDMVMKNVVRDSEILRRYVRERQPPPLTEEVLLKERKFRTEVMSNMNVDLEKVLEEERVSLRREVEKRTKRKLGEHVYNWTPIDYTDYVGKQYMIGRMPGEYASLIKIFYEIQKRFPQFSPTTLFDFGSGVGTVTWAALEFWKDSLFECFNVDSSREMNDVAKLLLQGGNEEASTPIKNLLYRQFLPASSQIKYDVVVSSHSLMDLPSMETRLETLLNLWNKTAHFLVLVENGTQAGFSLIHEARDFILKISQKDPNFDGVHVISPCPHELKCPRSQMKKSTCYFYVPYMLPALGRNASIGKEYYSYVVLKKGKRPLDDPQWPRVIAPVMKRTRHCITQACTKEGKLETFVFSKSKLGTKSYQVCRSTKWGDMLPINARMVDLDDEQGFELCDSSDYLADDPLEEDNAVSASDIVTKP